MHRLKSPGWEAQCEGTDADPFRLNTGWVSLFLHGFPGRWLLEPHDSTQRMGSPLLLQAPREQGGQQRDHWSHQFSKGHFAVWKAAHRRLWVNICWVASLCRSWHSVSWGIRKMAETEVYVSKLTVFPKRKKICWIYVYILIYLIKLYIYVYINLYFFKI